MQGADSGIVAKCETLLGDWAFGERFLQVVARGDGDLVLQ
jgi:hypothetical protein